MTEPRKNQFVIAPTHRIAANYLRSIGRNPREWTIVAFEFPDAIQKVRGVRGGIAEDIVTAPIGGSRNYERLLEIRQYLEIAGVEIKPVHY